MNVSLLNGIQNGLTEPIQASNTVHSHPAKTLQTFNLLRSCLGLPNTYKPSTQFTAVKTILSPLQTYTNILHSTQNGLAEPLWQAVCFKIVDPKIVLRAAPESTRL